jgi:predicted SpoU family rRNA methylase
VARISAALQARRFRHTNEKELQDGIESVLTEIGARFEREKQLGPKDRVDFFVKAGIALEVKIKGSLADVTRQLHRYAEHDQVQSILLVTAKARLGALPETLRGKPVRVVALLGGIS